MWVISTLEVYSSSDPNYLIEPLRFYFKYFIEQEEKLNKLQEKHQLLEERKKIHFDVSNLFLTLKS